MDASFEFKFLRALVDIQNRLRDTADTRKALIYILRRAKEVFGAPEAVLAILRPGLADAELTFALPQESAWDISMLTGYLRGARPPIPWSIILAPIRRRHQNWAVLALRNTQQEFTKRERQTLFLLTEALSDRVQSMDARRARDVRRKIEQKIARRRDPKDLIYDILHGLRSLTHYDHSAALFIAQGTGGPLELVAEQIAWTKARSKRIGMRTDLEADLRGRIPAGGVTVYTRNGDDWEASGTVRDPAFPRALAYDSDSDVPREVSMICAPIATPENILGILKVSARREGLLGEYEVGLIEEFMPLASLAIQFSVTTQSLQEQVLKTERKHALANLTRGITHDVNTALGATLPLVQQLLHDAATGKLRIDTLRDDLACIEESIQTCRRIFSGMLSIARGASRSGAGHGNLRRAIDGALSVLEDSLKRRAVDVTVKVPPELPTIRGGQGDLTQLFLNLFANARDAMPQGGQLTIIVRPHLEDLHVLIRDTGCGISEASLVRIQEPFYTTKAEGNGLGLSICRSILWDVGGSMQVKSQAGRGTDFHLTLPLIRAGDHDV